MQADKVQNAKEPIAAQIDFFGRAPSVFSVETLMPDGHKQARATCPQQQEVSELSHRLAIGDTAQVVVECGIQIFA